MDRQLLLRELRLLDFRCFHERQTARLAPLTFLVGDNSTGKTSFLAAIRALCEVAAERIEPDFRKPPYDLGGFPGIAHSRGGRGGRANSFEIGLTGDVARQQLKFDVEFVSQADVPTPAEMSWKMNDVWIKAVLKETRFIVDFGSEDGSWRFTTTELAYGDRWFIFPVFFYQVLSGIGDDDESWGTFEKLSGSLNKPGKESAKKFSHLLDHFRQMFWKGQPFAGAPIRSSPRRTYDPTRPSRDPEGAYVPTYLASMSYREKGKWNRLKKMMEAFGQDAGLFDEIGVRPLGNTAGGPFQMQIRKFGTRNKGPKRNLIDVGYGVSQTLPVVAELFRPDGPPVFLFQQPEVHLHPRAQAALGGLFCETAARGRQLIVETHSEYIIDRVRMDVRDGKANLKPADVSILFFERSNLDVRIHSLRYDERGNVLNAPDSYGQFFMDEMRRSVGL